MFWRVAIGLVVCVAAVVVWWQSPATAQETTTTTTEATTTTTIEPDTSCDWERAGIVEAEPEACETPSENDYGVGLVLGVTAGVLVGTQFFRMVLR